MADAKFFDAPTEASLKKQRTVSKYYGGWSNIVLPQAKNREGKLMYVELFSGPGKYRDGTRSTPLLILDHTIQTPSLRETVKLVFNDENADFVAQLERNISETPGIETLKFRPACTNRVVDRTIVPKIREINVPTLFFGDPWGYKGVSIDLIEAALSHWGSDFLFFFNYNRINMNLGSHGMDEPIDEFFRAELAKELRATISSLRPAQREDEILKKMKGAIKNLGAQVGIFTYRSLTGTRATHHLMCVSKHRNGMALFKEISAKESSRFDDDVPSLDHNPASELESGYLFSPLAELETELVKIFSGQVLTTHEIYHQHHNGRPFILRNYRQAILHLEESGAVKIDPPREMRTKPENLPQDARITFLKAG